jgi:voltage-gated potassium channel Kch
MDQNYLHEFRSRDRLSELVYRVWWLTSDCGRSFARWASWVVLITIVFAGLFTLVEIDYGDYPTAVAPFYFSVATLTTLGYGDVLPASAAAQTLAVIEVVIGYIALGGLLSIFANKMGRRAD